MYVPNSDDEYEDDAAHAVRQAAIVARREQIQGLEAEIVALRATDPRGRKRRRLQREEVARERYDAHTRSCKGIGQLIASCLCLGIAVTTANVVWLKASECVVFDRETQRYVQPMTSPDWLSLLLHYGLDAQLSVPVRPEVFQDLAPCRYFPAVYALFFVIVGIPFSLMLHCVAHGCKKPVPPPLHRH